MLDPEDGVDYIVTQLIGKTILVSIINALTHGISVEIMATVWRYCPNCYALADSNSLLKRCPHCPTAPHNQLQVLPLDPEAAQAALRIGGIAALVQMITTIIGGESARAEIARQSTYSHFLGCTYNTIGVCNMACDHGPPFHLRDDD